MVLAVDIGGDGATKGHVGGARHHRDEPAVWHELVDQLPQRPSGPCGHGRRIDVDGHGGT